MTLFALILTGLLVSGAAGCVPGDRSPIDGSCKSYLECSPSGEETVKSCEPGKVFNPNTKACDWSRNVKCENKPKKCEDGKTYSHPDSSRLYYSCTGGRLNLQYCPLMQVFDSASGTCKNSVILKAAEEPCSLEGSKKPADDCSRYYMCTSKKWVAMSCVLTTLFDAPTLSCVPKDTARCSKGCTEGKKIPDLNNCRKFSVCTNGQFVEDSCVWPREFDPSQSKCVWYGADCAKPPKPQ